MLGDGRLFFDVLGSLFFLHSTLDYIRLNRDTHSLKISNTKIAHN